MNQMLESIFGNRSAAQCLLFLEAYGAGHPSRIAATFGTPRNQIYLQLKRLEANGILVSKVIGRSRVFEFNPLSPTVRNLRAFLAAELELLSPAESEAYFTQRQRPRRIGKA